jgi:hypothetical protein
MKRQFMIVVSLLLVTVAFAQRTDVKWARNTTETMVVDGNMTEASWAAAESVKIRFGVDNGIPGSGWFKEGGVNLTDSTNATVKWLAKADSLYVGIRALDRSVGGGLFNRFDGILSNIRQRQQTGRPVGAGEIFYAWVSETWADTTCKRRGALPAFLGPWGSTSGGVSVPRSDSLSRATWFAATTVQGISNSDTANDVGYTMEFRINLRTFGYNVTAAAGDIVMYSLSIYDADWQWPLDTLRFGGNRAWYQCPWGNNNAYNTTRIHVRPDVTTTSGAVPTVAHEFRIPGANYPVPTLDGRLNESIWRNPGIAALQIQFGNAAIRNAYPAIAPYRSGQFQPTVNGGTAAVTDASLASVKLFYRGDSLYVGLDVNDRVVQAINIRDRWDGFRFSIRERVNRNGDNVLQPRGLTFRINGSGTAVTVSREDDLAPTGGSWDSAGTKVQVAVALKGGTSIDTLGASPDSGYTAEMVINLRQIGYPAGRGDGVLFFGATLYDGDSFTPITDSYGTRTWFMTENAGSDAVIWALMDPASPLAVDEKGNQIPDAFTLIGNYPNPFNPSTTIKFIQPQRSEVTLEVFNILGQLVATEKVGERQAGEQSVQFNAANLASGLYNYRLRMSATNETLVGKMMLVK